MNVSERPVPFEHPLLVCHTAPANACSFPIRLHREASAPYVFILSVFGVRADQPFNQAAFVDVVTDGIEPSFDATRPLDVNAWFGGSFVAPDRRARRPSAGPYLVTCGCPSARSQFNRDRLRHAHGWRAGCRRREVAARAFCFVPGAGFMVNNARAVSTGAFGTLTTEHCETPGWIMVRDPHFPTVRSAQES